MCTGDTIPLLIMKINNRVVFLKKLKTFPGFRNYVIIRRALDFVQINKLYLNNYFTINHFEICLKYLFICWFLLK